MAINWFKYSSPASFYSLAGKMIPLFAAAAVILLIMGLYIGFFIAPTDFQQGEAYRIIFIHVPAAWMSMFLYVVMACWAGFGLAFFYDGYSNCSNGCDVYFSCALDRIIVG